MNFTTNYTRVSAVTLAVFVSVALTGCFSNPLEDLERKVSEAAGEQGVEKLVEEMTGGGVEISFGEIPDGFPEEVPLISTNVVQSSTVESEDTTMMSVIIADPREPSKVAPDVRSGFADWEEEYWADVGDEMFTGQFRNDRMFILVSIMEDGDGSNVSYMVYPN